MIPPKAIMVVANVMATILVSLLGSSMPFTASRDVYPNTWTIKDLHAIATSRTMTAAVIRLGGGAAILDHVELEGAIDGLTTAGIRAALLGPAWSESDPAGSFPAHSSNIAQFVNFFAHADDPGDKTCRTAGTPGFQGLATCTTKCEEKTRFSLGNAPPAGACYAVCSLAVAPCNLRPFTSRRWMKRVYEVVHAAAIDGAKLRSDMCLRFTEFIHPPLEFLFDRLGYYVFDDARATFIVIFTFVIALASAVNYHRHRKIEARHQRESRARARARVLDGEAIIRMMDSERARVIALAKRDGENHSPTNVSFDRR